MLKLFSRMERTRSYVIIAFALLMGLSLVFFYAPSRNTPATASSMSREVLAEVRGDEITVGDLDALKADYKRAFGGQFNAMQLGGDRRMLDGLIRTRMISQEARRLGLAPSDGELADYIKRRFTNPTTNQFVGYDRYRQQIVSQYGSVERFEQQTRDILAEEKLRAFVTAGVSVPEEEVQQDWERRNTKFDLLYVPVLAADLARRVTPTDEELAAYYEAHKDEYRIEVPQKKVRYLYISMSKVGEKLQVSDEDLRKEFESLKPENRVKGVRVQQIVLKVAAPELDQQVLAKATDLVGGMRGDDLKATEEKFADLARGNSQDPATAKGGGWLPEPVRRDPNRKDDIYQNVFDMQEGEVRDPLFDRKTSAYYIFRRGPAIDKTFEDARPELLAGLRNRRSYNAALQLARRAAERLKATKDHDAVARELAAEANMNPADMVRETGFVKPQDDIPEIGSSPQFEQAIAPLNNVQDVGDHVSIRDGFAVPMLVDKRDPRVQELSEVRDRVSESVKQEKAKGQVEAAARELAAAGSADELKAAAERMGLKAETSAEYTLGSPLGAAGTSPSADEAIYKLTAGGVTKEPIKIGETWVVAAARGRKDADPTEFGTQRTQLIQTAIDERRSQVFDDYLTSLRAGLEREGQIKIDNDVLAKMSALEGPPVALPRGGAGGQRSIPILPPDGDE